MKRSHTYDSQTFIALQKRFFQLNNIILGIKWKVKLLVAKEKKLGLLLNTANMRPMAAMMINEHTQIHICPHTNGAVKGES